MNTIANTFSRIPHSRVSKQTLFSSSLFNNYKFMKHTYNTTSAAPTWMGKISLMIIALLFVGMANAASPSWNGNAGDNNWATASNWSTGIVPTTSDAVTISIGSSITISNVPVSLSLASLTFSASSGTPTLTLSGVSSAIGTLTINGDLTIGAGITVNDGGFTFAVGGNLSGSGTMVTNTTFATGRVQLTTAGGGKTIATGLTLGNLELLNTSGTNTASGAFTVTDNLTLTGGGTFSDGGNVITVGGNIINNTSTAATHLSPNASGEILMTGTSTVSGITSVTTGTGGSGYTISSTTLVVTFSAPNTTGGVQATGLASTNSSGQITGIVVTNTGTGYTSTPTITSISGGGSGGSYTVNRSSTSGSKSIFAAGAVANTNTSSTINFGNIELKNSNGDINIAYNSTVYVKGVLKFNSSNNATGRLLLSSNGTLRLDNGGNTYNGASTSISMNSGNVIRSLLNGNTGSIVINASGNVGTLYFDATNNKFAGLTFTKGTATFASTSSFNSSCTFAAGSSLTTTTGTNIYFLQNTLTLSGGLITLGTNSTMFVGSPTITAATSTANMGVDARATGAGVTFYNAANTASVAIGQYFFAYPTVYNLTDSLNNSTSATTFSLNASSSQLTVTNYKISNTNTKNLIFNPSPNIIIASGGSFTIQQTNTGTNTYTVPTYTSGNVSVAYLGSQAMTTGTELSNATNLQNLTINNSAGVTLGSAPTVNGTLYLTSGALSNSSYAVTMANGSTISRAAGTISTASTKLVFGTKVNVTITATCTAGNELLGTTGLIGTLTINGGGIACTYSLGAALAIDVLALPLATDGLNCVTFALSGNTSNTITSSGLGTVQTQCTSGTPLPQTTSGWKGTVSYNATSAQTVVGGTYTNLNFGATSTTTTLTASGNINVNGALTSTYAGNYLDMSTYQLGGTLSSVSIVGRLYIENTSSTPIPSGVNWGTSGTVYFDAGAAQSLPSGTFNNLNITTAGTAVSMTGSVTVNGLLYFNTGTSTLTVGANTLNINAGLTQSGSSGNINATNASATVIYNGALAQSIAANTYTSSGTISNLQINNAAGVTLNTPITVSGVLTLTAGQLITSATNIINVTNTAKTAITGESSAAGSSYINGPLKWTLPTSGSGDYIFPVGSGTNYYRLVLTSPTASVVGTIANVSVTTSNSGGTQDGTTLSAVSSTEYWSITASGGNITGGNLSLYRTGTNDASFDALGYSTTVNGAYVSLAGSASVGGDSIINSNAISTINSGSTNYYLMATKYTANPIVTGITSRATGNNVYFGDTITVAGNNFINSGLSVSFNGNTASYINYVDANHVQALVPAGTVSGTVSVTCGGVTSAGYGINIIGFISLHNGDWNTGSTWLGGNVPTTKYSVIVNNNVTVNAAVSGTYGDSSAVTINSGNSLSFGNSGSITIDKTLTNGGTIDMTLGGTLTLGNTIGFANSGTFTYGVGTVITSGTATITGTTPNFYNLTVGGALGLPASPSPIINYNLTFNSTTASLSLSPIYSSTATLQYSAAAPVGNEWGVGTSVGSILLNTGIGVGGTSASAAGTGYGLTNPAIIFTSGGGSGAAATATVGSLGYIAITSAGSGYTYTPTVAVSGGGGTGAVVKAVINTSTNTLTGVYIENPGSGYTSAPTLTVSGGGATTQAVLTGYLGITSVTVTSGGSGYTSMPTVNVATFVASTAYTLNQQVASGGYVYTVTTAGTTGASAPSFSGAITVGSTVTSGTVVFTNAGIGGAPSVAAYGAVGTGVPYNVIIGANITSPSGARVVNGSLTINNSSTFTTASTLALLGPLSVGTGSALNLASNALYVGNSFSNTGVGTIITSASGLIPSGQTWTGTIQYNNSSATYYTVTPGTYNNLNLNGTTSSSSFNIDYGSGYGGGVFNINGTLTWSGLANLGFNQTTFNFASGSSCVTTSGSSTMTFYNLGFNSTTIPSISGGSAIWTVGGVFSPQSGTTLTSASPITFTIGSGGGVYAGSQIIPAINYYNITVTGARTTNNVVLASSGIIGIVSSFTNSATFTTGAFVNTGSTVSYNGSSTQTITAFSYNNLTIGGTSRSGAILLPSSTINVAGTFNVSYTGSPTFSTSGNTLNLNGSSNTISSTFTYNTLNLNSGSLTLSAATTGNGVNTVASGATLILGSGGALTNTGGVSMNGTLQMNGGSISAAPTYTSATLQYTATSTVDNEWPSGTGTNVPQTIVFNAGSGTVTTPPTLRTIEGDLTITSGTLKLGSGGLQVNGNWYNNGGTLDAITNSATVTMAGNSATVISKGSGTETFYGLTVNNSGGVTLNNDVNISGSLTLTSGLLTTNTKNLTVKCTSATSSTGSNSSYIDGPLTMDLTGSSSSATYYFPVGNANNLLQFALVNPIVSGTATATVQAFLTGNTGTPDASLSSVGNEYWSFSATSNFSSAAGIGLPSASNSSAIAKKLAGVYSSLGGNVASGMVTETSTSITNVAQIFSVGVLAQFGITGITVLSPVSGQSSSANSAYIGQTIDINGQQFTSNTSITINGIPVSKQSLTGSTDITVIVPSTSTGKVINITATDGSSSDNAIFTILGYGTTNAGDWNTSSTWIGGTIPPANSTVYINHAVTVNGTVSAAPDTIVVNTSNSITFGASGSLVCNNYFNNKATVNMTLGGTLGLGGNITIGTFNVGTGTVNLTGGTQNIPVINYYNLGITNNTTATATVALSVSNTLNIASGSTLDLNSFSLSSVSTTSGTGSLLASANTSTPIPASKTWAFTVNYSGSGAQTVVNGSYSTLTVSGARVSNPTITFGSAINIANDFNYTASGLGATTVTGSTITFNGTTQNINNAFTFNGLTVNSGSTVAANAAITVTTLALNGTLNMGINALSGSSLTTSGTGTLQTSNTSTTPIPASKTWSCLVEYTATSGGQTIPSASTPTLFNGGLKCDNTSGIDTLIGGSIYLSGKLSVATGGIFTLGGNNMRTNSSIDFSSMFGTLRLSSSATACQFPPNSIFPTGSKVWYYGTGNNRIVPATYYNVNVDNGVSQTINFDTATISTATFTVNGTLSTVSTTTTAKYTTWVFNGTSQNIPAWNYYNLTVNSSSNLPTTGNVNIYGTFNPNGLASAPTGSTIQFSPVPAYSDVNISLPNNFSFYNLGFTGSGNTLTNATGTTTSGSKVVTLTTNSIDTLVVSGAIVTGTNIPSNTTISGIGSMPAYSTAGDSMTYLNIGSNYYLTNLSVNDFNKTNSYNAITTSGFSGVYPTAHFGGGTKQGTWQSGNTSFTCTSSTTGLNAGMYVSGTGIPANTYITSISGSTVNVNNTITGTQSSATNFYYTPELPLSGAPTGISSGITQVFSFSPAIVLSNTASGSGTVSNISTNKINVTFPTSLTVNDSLGDNHSGTYSSVTVNGSINMASSTKLNIASTNFKGALNIATGTVTAAGNVTLNNTLNIASGAILNMSTYTLSSGSGFSNTGTGMIQTQNTGTTAIPSGITWSGTVKYNHATSSQTVVAGNYANLDLSGGSGGRTFINGGSIGIAGTFTQQTSGNTTLTGSTVVLNGSSVQTIPSFTYNNLTLNNSAGFNTLSSNLTVNGLLTLTKGSVDLGNENMIAASILGGSNTAYILTTGTGTLTVKSVGATSTLFPIGVSSSSYTPLTISNTTGTSDLTVGVSSTIANSVIDPTKIVNLQWSVVGSVATTASITYQFNSSDKAAGYVAGSTNQLGIYSGTGRYNLLTASPTGSPYTFVEIGLSIPATGSTNLYVVGNNGSIESPTTSWTGTYSTDWSDYHNWDNGVPANNVDAIIPSGTTYSPTINVSVATRDLTLNTNVTLTNNSSLQLNRGIIINGTINGTGTTTISGSVAQTINGTGSISNLTINNSAGVSISGGNQSITGILKVTAGQFNTGTNGLTLKSTSIDNSAVVDQVGGSITGTATVERYIPQGYRAYRDMAPQVYNAGTIFKNWQESGSVTANTGIFITGAAAADPNNAKGVTSATSLNPTPGSGSNFLDWSLNGIPSCYNFLNSTGKWTSGLTHTDTALDVFQGYRVLIRGARDFNLYLTGVPSNEPGQLDMLDATTLRATGNLVYGDVTYTNSGVSGTANGGSVNSTNALNSSTDTSFSIVANPYVCPVNWASVYTASGAGSSGLNASYWYLDPTTASTGGYFAYNAASGSSIEPVLVYDKSGASSTYNLIAPSGYIQAGQAFFVQNQKSQTPTLKFTESAKVASSTKLSVFGTTTPLSKIYLSLLKNNAGTYTLVDGAAAAFSSSFTNTYGPQDAKKISGSSDNLFITDKGRSLSIDGRLPATASDILPISLSSLSGTTYQLVVNASTYTANGFAPYLVDAYSKTTTAITGIDTIAFTANTSVAATYKNRFSIVFKPTTLSVNSIVATVIANGNTATITWNTVGEKGVAKFEVEKSTDGSSFASIGQQTAKNTATASYTAIDKDVVATTFYRIKAISTDGTIAYSNTVKLTTNHLQLTTIYPNPLTGKTLNVQLGNVVAGKYVVSIYNSLGQKVVESAITHAGGNGTHAVNIEGTVAAGVYNVIIRELNSKEQVFQSSLSVQ